MKFFRSPYLIKGRDVLVVVCDKCDMLASELVNNIPLCPAHAQHALHSDALPTDGLSAENKPGKAPVS